MENKYKIVFRNTVKKDARKLPPVFWMQIRKRVLELANDPRPIFSKKLKGHDNLFRLKVGVYRVIYQVDNGRFIIIVLKVAHRKDIYRGF